MSVSQFASNSHTIILASAGSGKTYRLTLEYIQLLLVEILNNDAADSSRIAGQILATTFTRKAAAELQQRILYRLSEAAISEEAYTRLINELNQLKASSQVNDQSAKIDFNLISKQRLLEIVCQLSWRLDRLKIATLDSFFQKLCGAFSHYLELPDSEEQALMVTSEEDPRLKRLRYTALRDVLDSQGRMTCLELLQRLNHQRGKRSIQQLLDSIVKDLSGWYRQVPAKDGWQQLVVPHTPLKSASEIERAIDQLADHVQHAYAGQARVRKSILANCDDALRGDWEAFVSKGIAQKIMAGEDTFYRLEIDASLQQYYQPLLTHACHELLSQQKQYLLSVYQLLHAFSSRYSHLRYDAGLMLFDDFPYQLVNHFDDIGDYTSEILYRLDTQIKHILLDEHQDTSLLQWRILKPFLGEIAAVNDGSRTLVAVGDRKQAIYGWRGGESEIFDLFETELHLSSDNWITIARNFRSSQPVLDACNQVFKRLTGDNDLFSSAPELRLITDTWQRRYPEHTANDQSREGCVYLMAACEDDDSDSDSDSASDTENAEGSKPAQDRKSLLLETKVNFIKRLYDRIKKEQPSKPKTIGVLCSNNKTAASLLFQLKQLGLPATSETGRSLAEDPGVICLLSLLSLIDHPDDSAAAYRVLHSPLKAAIQMTSIDKEHLHELCKRLRFQIALNGLQQVLMQLAAAITQTPNVQRSSIEQLIELAGEFERDQQISSELRVERFVELAFTRQFAHQSQATDHANHHEHDKHDEQAGTVKIQVMTIHKSKGLEFNHVVLPDLDDRLAQVKEDIVPYKTDAVETPAALYSKSNKKIRALSTQLMEAYRLATERRFKEDLCVLYVAMTRARDALWMIVDGKAPENRLSYANLLKYSFKPQDSADRSEDNSKEIETLLPDDTLSVLHSIGRFPKVQPSKLDKADNPDNPDKADTAQPTQANEAGHLVPISYTRRPTQPYHQSASERPLESLFQQIDRTSVGETNLFGGMQAEPSAITPIQRGVLWHFWFSQIEWIQSEAELPSQNTLLEMTKRQPSPQLNLPARQLNETLHEEANRFIALLSLTRSMFKKPDKHAMLWREQPFSVILDGQFIQGRFDRVVIEKEKATIYDFKTDTAGQDEPTPNEGWSNGKKMTYKQQMTTYRRALSQMLQLPEQQISTQLVFVQYGLLIAMDHESSSPDFTKTSTE